MKKYLFLCFLYFAGVSGAAGQEQQVMNNPNGYSYRYHKTFSNVSFQDISNPYNLGSAALSLDYWRGRFVFNNVSFLRNKTGVYVVEGNVSLTDAEFSGNTNGGIVISPYNGNGLTMTRVTFSNNHATNGAGIYTWMTDSKSWGPFTQVSFTNNTAENRGGALYLALDKQRLQDASFSGNRAASGGALYTTNKFTLSGNNISFSSNEANQGGAIFAENDFVLSGGNITFSDNTAAQGGAIYAGKNLTLRAENGNITFSGNSGGAVYLADASTRLYLQPTPTGSIIFDDALAPSTKVRAEGNGLVFFNHKTDGLSADLAAGTVYLNPAWDWTDSALTFNGGNLLISDGQTSLLSLGEVTLNASITLLPDVDMQAGKMDSLSIQAVNGGGAVQVGGFNFLSSDASAPTTLHFIDGAGKTTVQTVRETQDDVFAYQVDYNAQQGDITFTPKKLLLSKGIQSAKAFAAAATVQPLSAYAAADGIHRMLEKRGDLRLHEALRYDNPHARFYVRPYYQNTQTDFTNDASAKNKAQGLVLGWFSNDWEWFDETLASGGWYVSAQQDSLDYDAGTLKQTHYQLGGDVFFSSYRFFFGLTAQAGTIRRTSGLKDDALTAGARAVAGFNADLSAAELFLQPYAAYSGGYVGKGKDAFNGSARLTGQNFLLHQVQGGARLVKLYGETWSAYLDGSYVKRFSSQKAFYAADQQLPVFETDAFPQAGAGIQMDGEKWGVSADVKASFGAVKSLEASVSVAF
ncbi:MAG: hypothetical protein ACI37O_00190 [Candidatus Avelusimicrobium sp.]|uniref:right-handed parallel beta-helix repeat-containing protein n=1 Tax=Candidatus Avelusimicrobium sp. TaxID=3048833 RepID=UPI003F082651